MSDESTSSTAAIPAPPFGTDANVDLRDVFSGALRRRKIKTQKSLFNRMRAHLLDDLVRNLDILVYAELSTIYYMDCYIFRFLLRSLVQFMFLTPKPALFPAPPKPEPFVGAIVGTNLLCLILHVFSAAPSAGENTRFYLHGGLLIDFIGQRGPTSKLLLVVLDLLVLSLQLIHLSAHVTIRKLRDDAQGRVLTTVAQDIDSEERGVRRSVEVAREQVQDGIELQSLNPNGSTRQTTATQFSSTSTTADETAEPQQDFEEGPRSDSILFDAFKNGQIVLADFNILRTVREQILIYQKTPPEIRRSALSAHLAGRLMGLRMLTGRAGT